MALPIKKNLGQLRSELKDGLGQTVGAAANTPLLNGMLFRAQVFIFKRLVEKERTTHNESITSGGGQEKYDWPDTIHPKKTMEIWVEDTTDTDNNMYKMVEGIERRHYGQQSTVEQDRPRRYERRAQLEVWPLPEDNRYIFHIEGQLRLGRFTVDTDLVTVDEDLVAQLALANAKAHYRHPDANAVAEQFTLMMRADNADELGHERFVRPTGSRRTNLDVFEDRSVRHRNTLDI